MKTNEELAMMIQDGDKTRIPELWERVRGIYLKKAFRYYGSYKPLCDRCGVSSKNKSPRSSAVPSLFPATENG